jgi:ferrochelatase
MAKKHLLLVNLGSPEHLTLTAIRNFLQEFLTDKRVVGLPRYLWYPILYGIILPLRVPKLLLKYKSIYLANGKSPLIYYTAGQAQGLQALLDADSSVDYAFCYGSKLFSIDAVLKRKSLHMKCNSELIIVPLFPQYSSATSAAVFDQVAQFYAREKFIPSLRFIHGFAVNRIYIKALANSVRKLWSVNPQQLPAKLLVSFHSIPLRMVAAGDSYPQECELTFNLLCKELQLKPGQDAILSYQSRFGGGKWLAPATNTIIQELAQSGNLVLDVLCPGFVSDCLETLEEIAIQYRELFLFHGGQELRYIPALNDSQEVARILQEICT